MHDIPFLPLDKVATDVKHVVPVYAKEPDTDVKGGKHLVLDR